MLSPTLPIARQMAIRRIGHRASAQWLARPQAYPSFRVRYPKLEVPESLLITLPLEDVCKYKAEYK